jgi:outer membrane lipoprotein-sorting protein
LPRLGDLRRNFELTSLEASQLSEELAAANATLREKAILLRLRPAHETLKAQVWLVDVVIDASRGCVSAIEMVDVDGERTVISFADIKLNQGVSSEQLELDVPPDTKVSRPLQGVGIAGDRVGQ